jgi:hypothetical protein
MDDKKTITITIEEYNSLLEKQKQVDELKAENNRYAELFGMGGKDFYTVEVGEWEKVKSGVKDMIQQAVKDTAKEIFPKVKERLKHLDNEWEISNALYPLEQEYLNGKGVEVE